MTRPYQTGHNRTIKYTGNRIFKPIEDVSHTPFPTAEIETRATQIGKEKMWGPICRINHQIYMSTCEYFDKLGALFTPLPMTTRMISSPGAVYGKEAIDYTTDTCPIKLQWFDLPQQAFLSESSQIYLELALMQEGVHQVFSIYNSFRKEHADETHLSEFRHIEYEGQVSQEQNERIVIGLLKKIIGDTIEKREGDLQSIIGEEEISGLARLCGQLDNIPKISYHEALAALYEDTGDEKYTRFTMQNNFGSWEEIRLTEIYDNLIAINGFPLLEVPFYHAQKVGVEPAVADNTDFIWPGYRETIGSGRRIGVKEELEKKAQIFNLPPKDYAPYLQSRDSKEYVCSAGFGLGWERLLQGMLKMPMIWSAVQFPRGHTTIKP